MCKIYFMPKKNVFPYDFTIREFKYNKATYKVALTPELFPDGPDLDFTGNYLGILISSKRGTSTFELNKDHHLRWEPVPKGMDPGLIDELDKIIVEIRGKK